VLKDFGATLSKAGPVLLILFAWSLPTSLFGMQLFAGLGALLLIGRSISERSFNFFKTSLNGPIALFLSAIVLSLLFAPHSVVSFRGATSSWVLLTFYVTVNALDSGRTLNIALRGLVILACCVSLFAVYQSLTGHYPLGELIHPNISPLMKMAPGMHGLYSGVGLFFSRLTLAHVLLFPFCWTLSLSLEKGAPSRLWATCASAVILVGMVFTWTRASLVVAVFCCVTMFLWRLRGLSRWLACTGMAVAMIAAFFFSPALTKKVVGSFSNGHDWGRLAIWHVAMDLVAEQPLTGIGYGNFQSAAASRIEQKRKEVGAKEFKGVLAWAHNNLLSFLAEAGAIGAVAFCWLFVAYFMAVKSRLKALCSNCYPHRKSLLLYAAFLRGSMLAVIAFLLVGLVHDTFFDGEVIFCLWFTLGASLGFRFPEPGSAE
jgi:putative inorganic carbon (HCO3(-)) transporter